jgi:DNA-binding transcriptional LysR family regulator
VVADLLASGALKEVRTVLPVITRQCYWVVHRDKHASAALQRCVDVLSAGASIL